MRQVLTRPAVSPHPLMSAITVLTTLLVGSVMLGTFVATWIVVADACVSALFGAAAGAMTPISGTLGAGALTTLVVFRN